MERKRRKLLWCFAFLLFLLALFVFEFFYFRYILLLSQRKEATPSVSTDLNEKNHIILPVDPQQESPFTESFEEVAFQQYRLFNDQQYFLSSFPFSIQSMQNPAVVLIACRRQEMVESLLSSLAKMTTIHDYSVYISFGCSESLSRDNSSLVESFRSIYPSIQFLSYSDPPDSPSIPPPFLRIQLHYVFILKEIFEVRKHSEVILLEDDLAVSPSLLNYYEQTFQLLYQDPSILCISAYNDNAQSEMMDIHRLRRTQYFPNLALLFHHEGYNRIWKDQLLDSTTNGWDHWLRIRVASLHGECVYPVVPRVRHLPSSNSSTVSKALSKRLQKYPLVEESTVDLGNVSYLLQANYDQSLLRAFLAPSIVPSTIERMKINMNQFLASHQNISSLVYPSSIQWKSSDIIILIDGKDDIRKLTMYSHRIIVVFILREQFQKYLHSLHLFSTLRGFHHGILSISMKGNEVFFIERRYAWYVTPPELQIQLNPQGQIIQAEKGQSCEESCNLLSSEMVCDNVQMQFVNDCNVMKQYFPCQRGCWNEFTNAIPSYCEGDKGYGGMCLISHDAFSTCDTKLQGTIRLCYCIESHSRIVYPFKTPVLRSFSKNKTTRANRIIHKKLSLDKSKGKIRFSD